MVMRGGPRDVTYSTGFIKLPSTGDIYLAQRLLRRHKVVAIYRNIHSHKSYICLLLLLLLPRC